MADPDLTEDEELEEGSNSNFRLPRIQIGKPFKNGLQIDLLYIDKQLQRPVDRMSLKSGSVVKIVGRNLDLFNKINLTAQNLKQVPLNLEIFNDNITFTIPDFEGFLSKMAVVRIEFSSTFNKDIDCVLKNKLYFLTSDSDEEKKKEKESEIEQEEYENFSKTKNSGGNSSVGLGTVMSATNDVLAAVTNPFLPNSVAQTLNRANLKKHLETGQGNFQQMVAQARKNGDLEGLKEVLAQTKDDKNKQVLNNAISELEKSGAKSTNVSTDNAVYTKNRVKTSDDEDDYVDNAQDDESYTEVSVAGNQVGNLNQQQEVEVTGEIDTQENQVANQGQASLSVEGEIPNIQQSTAGGEAEINISGTAPSVEQGPAQKEVSVSAEQSAGAQPQNLKNTISGQNSGQGTASGQSSEAQVKASLQPTQPGGDVNVSAKISEEKLQPSAGSGVLKSNTTGQVQAGQKNKPEVNIEAKLADQQKPSGQAQISKNNFGQNTGGAIGQSVGEGASSGQVLNNEPIGQNVSRVSSGGQLDTSGTPAILEQPGSDQEVVEGAGIRNESPETGENLSQESENQEDLASQSGSVNNGTSKNKNQPKPQQINQTKPTKSVPSGNLKQKQPIKSQNDLDLNEARFPGLKNLKAKSQVLDMQLQALQGGAAKGGKNLSKEGGSIKSSGIETNNTIGNSRKVSGSELQSNLSNLGKSENIQQDPEEDDEEDEQNNQNLTNRQQPKEDLEEEPVEQSAKPEQSDSKVPKKQEQPKVGEKAPAQQELPQPSAEPMVSEAGSAVGKAMEAGETVSTVAKAAEAAEGVEAAVGLFAALSEFAVPILATIGVILLLVLSFTIFLYGGCNYPNPSITKYNRGLSYLGLAGQAQLCKDFIDNNSLGSSINERLNNFQSAISSPGGLLSTAKWSESILNATQKFPGVDACILKVVVAKESAGQEDIIGCDCAYNGKPQFCPNNKQSNKYYEGFPFNWEQCSYGIGLTQWTIFQKQYASVPRDYRRWLNPQTPSRSPFNANFYTVEDFLNPNTSLELTAEKFSRDLKVNGNSVEKAFASYVGQSSSQNTFVAERMALYNLCKQQEGQ